MLTTNSYSLHYLSGDSFSEHVVLYIISIHFASICLLQVYAKCSKTIDMDGLGEPVDHPHSPISGHHLN